MAEGWYQLKGLVINRMNNTKNSHQKDFASLQGAQWIYQYWAHVIYHIYGADGLSVGKINSLN